MAQRTGYLFIDHRASPGIPEDLARAAGYDPAMCKEGKVFETDTYTCAHCKTVFIKNHARIRERYKCMKCSGHFICDGCHYVSTLPDYNHVPYEKKLDLVITDTYDLAAIPPLLREAQ